MFCFSSVLGSYLLCFPWLSVKHRFDCKVTLNSFFLKALILKLQTTLSVLVKFLTIVFALPGYSLYLCLHEIKLISFFVDYQITLLYYQEKVKKLFEGQTVLLKILSKNRLRLSCQLRGHRCCKNCF